jgi:hypothetical protein
MPLTAVLAIAALVGGAAPATRPATRSGELAVECPRKGDTVVVTAEGDRVVLVFSSPRGIGSAIVSRGAGSWPKSLVLRLELKGLESLALTCGNVSLVTEVSSTDHKARHSLRLVGKDTPMAHDSPFSMPVRSVAASAAGPAYFEVAVPAALLGPESDRLTIHWIDFYRL